MLCPAHNPSEARKVGNPLSALIPAPVSTNTRSSALIEIVLMINFYFQLTSLQLSAFRSSSLNLTLPTGRSSSRIQKKLKAES
jgi:hypothetical protein